MVWYSEGGEIRDKIFQKRRGRTYRQKDMALGERAVGEFTGRIFGG